MPTINTCAVTGNVKTLLGSNVQNCVVKVSVTTPFFHSGSLISGEVGSVTTNSSGDFSVSVIETTTVGQKVTFTFEYYDGVANRRQKKYTVVIPDTATTPLADLVTADAFPATVTTLPAANVTVAAISGLTADDAQDAFAEHQGDIDDLNDAVDVVNADLTAHIADTTDAHAASAISLISPTNMSSTDVQAAFEEVQAEIDVLNALPDGKIYIGDASGVISEAFVTGDITMTNTGVASISSAVIVNADVSPSAAIAYSKLSLTGGIVNADVNASAAITFSKISGTVPLNQGGTGQTTKAPAFDALSPMSASGDIIYGGASGTGTRLAKGSDGQVLALASGLPSWITTANGDVSSNTASSVDSEIALFSGTGGKTIKRATGSGAVSVASGVYTAGTLSQANGGTGQTSIITGGTGNASNPAVVSGAGTAATSGSSNWTSLNANCTIQWLRVGNVVSGSGYFNGGASGTGNGFFDMALPVASTFAAATNAGGSFHCPTLATFNGSIYANTSTNKLKFQWNAPATNFVDFYFTFTYQVL